MAKFNNAKPQLLLYQPNIYTCPIWCYEGREVVNEVKGLKEIRSENLGGAGYGYSLQQHIY